MSPSTPLFPTADFDVVVVGASLGGLEALAAVVAPLPADFPVPILVVQHVRGDQPSHLPALLGRRTRLCVRHAEDGERLCAGTVHVAPPNRHLLVRDGARCGLSDAPRVHFARPAADPLFASAAERFGGRVLAVVLSGRLRDGADGARCIRRAGGVVIAQEPETCRAPGMPQAAIAAGAADFVLSPPTIAAALVSLVAVPGVATVFGVGARRVA